MVEQDQRGGDREGQPKDDGDRFHSGLVVTAMPKVTLRKIRNFKTLPFILCRN
jgi:hypothetical protein